MSLTHKQRLEGLYGITAETLGLTSVGFDRRTDLWAQLSKQRLIITPGLAPAQADAHVEVMALRNWQSVLISQADKFRAEGDITTERDITTRLAEIRGWLSAAEAAAGLSEPAPTSSGPPSSNPAPNLSAWGIDG